MSNLNDNWNPEDGPPPTEAELAEARALAGALAGALAAPLAAPEGRPADPDVADLVNVAMRLRATAQPDPAAARDVVRRAVDHAVLWSRSPFNSRRWRWGVVAAAAALLLGVGVGGLETRTQHATPMVSITRPATDVFTAPVQPGAGSMPSDRIYGSRLHDYRAVLLGGGRL